MNPYTGQSFFGFLKTLFLRVMEWTQGVVSPLASDELQMGVLALIAISSAIVGVLLVHRRMTMLANALSHTVIFGIVLTYLILRETTDLVDPTMSLKALLIAAVITGFITSYLSHIISKISGLQKDASIGLIFTTFFALGILLVTLFSRNSHIGIDMIMGNVDALHPENLYAIFKITLLNVLICALLFRGLKLSTFDPLFAKLQGFSPAFFNMIVVSLLSLTAISAFRAIGVVLVLSFFIVPPYAVKRYSKSLKMQMLLAALFGAMGSIFGVALSRHLFSVYGTPLSTGGLTVLSLYLLYGALEVGYWSVQKSRTSIFLRQKKKELDFSN